MFTTVFPPIVDALLASIGLLIVSFWTSVFAVTAVRRLVRVAKARQSETQREEVSEPIVVLSVALTVLNVENENPAARQRLL